MGLSSSGYCSHSGQPDAQGMLTSKTWVQEESPLSLCSDSRDWAVWILQILSHPQAMKYTQEVGLFCHLAWYGLNFIGAGFWGSWVICYPFTWGFERRTFLNARHVLHPHRRKESGMAGLFATFLHNAAPPTPRIRPPKQKHFHISHNFVSAPTWGIPTGLAAPGGRECKAK